MHPLDTRDRTEFIRDQGGVGLCNITKCCTEVCPEHIHITDNGIIPLKERMADNFDPSCGWCASSGATRRRRPERMKIHEYQGKAI